MKFSSLAILLAALVAVRCHQNNEVIVEPTGEYSTSVQPIFDQRCGSSSCHGGGTRGFAGALDLSSYDGVMRGSKYGASVVSGSPYMSHHVQSINSID